MYKRIEDIKREAYAILDGKPYYWSRWGIDEMIIGKSEFASPSFRTPSEWLGEMFDNRYSAYLFPMPKETLN